MAIRANWYQVRYWVHLILFANFPNSDDVVDMNETFTDRAINTGEVESANGANIAVICDARCPSFRISLICVNRDAVSCALGKLPRRGKFLCKRDWGFGVGGIPSYANSRERFFGKLRSKRFNLWDFAIFPTRIGRLHWEGHQLESFFLNQPNVFSRLVVTLTFMASRVHLPILGENKVLPTF